MTERQPWERDTGKFARASSGLPDGVTFEVRGEGPLAEAMRAALSDESTELLAAEPEVEAVEGETIYDGLPAADLLREIVQRAERLEAAIAELQSDKRDVLAEGKVRGLDPKALREVLRRRKLAPSVRADLDGMVGIYESALGDMPRGLIDGGELRRPAVQSSGGSAGLRAALIWAGASNG